MTFVFGNAPVQATADTHADLDWIDTVAARDVWEALEPEFVKIGLRRPDEHTPEATDGDRFI